MVTKEKTDTRKYGFVIILGLAGFISAADNWFVSPVLPAIASGFNISIPQAGAIITAYMIPYGLMQPVYGFFSDRKSKVKTLRWIVLGLSLCTAGCSLSTSLWMLCAFRFLTGFFAAGIIAVSLALIGDTIPGDLRQIYVGRFMGIVFLGQGISAGLGGLFAKYMSWRVAFIFFCFFAFSVFFLLFRLPDNLPVIAGRDKKFFPELKFVVTTQKGKIIFPLALAVGILLIGMYSYLGAYLHEVLGLNYLQGGIIVMFYGLSCLTAGSLVGRLSSRIGKVPTILSGWCFALVTALGLAFSSSWQIALAAAMALGFGYIFVQSTLATIAFDISRESTGLSSGLVGVGLFIGGGIGTSINGFLLEHMGYTNLWFVISGGIVLLIMTVVRLYFMDKKNSILTNI